MTWFKNKYVSKQIYKHQQGKTAAKSGLRVSSSRV